MRISTILAVGYLLIVALAAWLVLDLLAREIEPRAREVMEDTLVDGANLLAELVAPDLAAGTLQQGRFTAALRRYGQRRIEAGIWDLKKHSLDYRVYVTDTNGRVLASTDPAEVGRDYSRWRDVYLTLRGRYGARSTRDDPDDDSSSVMHVAAPVELDGRLLGVVTLAKPGLSVEPFIQRSKARLRDRGLLLVLVAGLIGALFTWRLTRSIGRLSRYARDVSAGRRSPTPRSSALELDALGQALAAMRERLEGRGYVERYVHTLTHELKAPLAAIRGAAELLAEPDMAPEERQRFLGNIREQESRLSLVADKMLQLARVEQQQVLHDKTTLDLSRIVSATVEAQQPRAMSQRVRLVSDAEVPAWVLGNDFLLRQALTNLLDNALDFSPAGESVNVRVETVDGWVQVQVEDRGPGIPDYAAEKVFERFYSLPRPSSGRKGTGLGLTFVREVAELHGGEATLSPAAEEGTLARLRLPAATSSSLHRDSPSLRRSSSSEA